MILMLSKTLTLTLNHPLTMRSSRACLSPPPLKGFCVYIHACSICLIIPDSTDTKHSTILKLQVHPCFLAYERLSSEKMTILKREISKLLELGVLVPSDSEYSSPVHLVPKKNGEYRITRDFRFLNEQTKVDKYPISFLTDFVNAMAGSIAFSGLDLYKLYYQLELVLSSVHKTAMCTPIGLFAYKRLAMGMKTL